MQAAGRVEQPCTQHLNWGFHLTRLREHAMRSSHAPELVIIA